LEVTKKAEEATSLQIKVTMCCHNDVRRIFKAVGDGFEPIEVTKINTY
jgi:hypothetical protein